MIIFVELFFSFIKFLAENEIDEIAQQIHNMDLQSDDKDDLAHKRIRLRAATAGSVAISASCRTVETQTDVSKRTIGTQTE